MNSSHNVAAAAQVGVVLDGAPVRTAVIPSPETVIRLALSAAQDPTLKRAARYFIARDPAEVQQLLDRLSDQGKAVAFEVHTCRFHGATATFRVTTFADFACHYPLCPRTISFLRKGPGWAITRVN